VDSLDALGAIFARRKPTGVVVIDPGHFPPLQVMEMASAVPVLFVGRGDDSSSMIACVEAGALGYADFEAPLESLVQAISSVVNGVPVIPPLMLGSLLKHVVERRRGHRRAQARLEVLSNREREVFELTARGCDRQGVADALFISPATVRTHVQNTFRKLDLHSMAELVALAAECGLELGPNYQRGAG
jgi:DNA-binding NarL/FixJ family response regulator